MLSGSQDAPTVAMYPSIVLVPELRRNTSAQDILSDATVVKRRLTLLYREVDSEGKEAKAMFQFKCKFSVDNHMTTQIVTANSQFDARKLVEAQYSGKKIVWYECTKA